tara:strand:+ start:453 stop:638 length:186 start_codon:yes stop_codon:yes gene_type:complete
MQKFILYCSVFTTLAFIIYGVKTLIDGNTLNKEFWLTGIMLIGTQVPFYLQYKEKSKSGKK